MYRPKLPAFSAEASLAGKEGAYRADGAMAPAAGGDRIVPSMRPMCTYLSKRCAGGDGQACVWYFENC